MSYQRPQQNPIKYQKPLYGGQSPAQSVNKVLLKPLNTNPQNYSTNSSINNSNLYYNNSMLYNKNNNGYISQSMSGIELKSHLNKKQQDIFSVNNINNRDKTMGNIRKNIVQDELTKQRMFKQQIIYKFKKNIIGYTDNQFISPFNIFVERFHSGQQRLFQQAETNIQHIVNQKHIVVPQPLMEYTQNSLLYSFQLKPSQFACFPITKSTCSIIVDHMKDKESALKDGNAQEFDRGNQRQDDGLHSNQKEVVVFVAPDFTRYAIFPWIESQCHKLELMQNDQFLKIKEDKMRQQLQMHQDKQRIILIKQISQLKQLQNHLFDSDIIIFYLNYMENLDQFFKDCPKQLQNIVDFFFVYTGSMIACKDTANFLFMNKKYLKLEDELYDDSIKHFQSQIEKLQTYSQETGQEIDQTQFEIVKYYRTALVVQYQAQSVTVQHIKELQQLNEQKFKSGVQRINSELEKENQLQNYIQFYGIENNNSLHFNIIMTNTKQQTRHYQDIQGKWIIHPQLVSQLLEDIFGIQVREQNILQEENFEEIVKFVVVDNYFMYESYEIEYILQALKQVCLYFPNIQESYIFNEVTKKYEIPQKSKVEQPYIMLGLSFNPNSNTDEKIESNSIDILFKQQEQHNKKMTQIWKNQLKDGEKVFINHLQFLQDQNLIKQINYKFNQQQKAINKPSQQIVQTLQNSQLIQQNKSDDTMPNNSELMRSPNYNGNQTEIRSSVVNQFQTGSATLQTIQQNLGGSVSGGEGQQLQPSIMFNNQLSNQQKRSKSLLEIFQYYVNIQEYNDGKLNIQSFLKFTTDFKILEDYISEREFSEFLKKQAIGMKGMNFQSFVNLLEEVSKLLFKLNQDNLTTYDCMEQFYTQVIYLQDPNIFRSFFGTGDEPIDPRQKAKIKIAKKTKKQLEDEQLSKKNTQYQNQTHKQAQQTINQNSNNKSQQQNKKDNEENQDTNNQTQQKGKTKKRTQKRKKSYGVEAAYNDLFADETFLGLQQKNQQELEINNQLNTEDPGDDADDYNNTLYINTVQNNSQKNINQMRDGSKLSDSQQQPSKFANLNHDKM